MIVYFDLKGINQQVLAENLSESYWLPSYLYKEWCFQWNDYITRTTGRLTKMIRIADIMGVDRKKVTNFAAWSRDDRAIEIIEGLQSAGSL